jgi:phospholipase/lecithinase/hemolysin
MLVTVFVVWLMFVLFSNALHPTGAAHTLFGKEVGNLLAGTPF